MIDKSRTLAREVRRAGPGAHVETVDAWTAIERLAAERFELVVVGDTDIGLASLVRIVARCDPRPALMIANDEPNSMRMRTKFPHIARYFVDRPIATEDLRRVLRLS